MQKIIDSFWKHWNRDVFPSLVPRKKWRMEKRDVRPDDIVVVSDPNALRGKWLVGRVLEVHPGLDGRVRNVEVKTTTGTYSRPLTKIAVFPWTKNKSNIFGPKETGSWKKTGNGIV